MNSKSQVNVRSLTTTAMMTAILCVFAPFSIPIGDVPISLATFVVYFSAVLLGMKKSLICVSLYILIGMVGIPVFSGWKSGVAVLAGPTGGYIVGYLLIAFCTGLLLMIVKYKLAFMILGMLIGTIGCYALGTIWLAVQLSLSPKAALWVGVIPFLPGDVIKIVATVCIAVPVRKYLGNFLEVSVQ